jgi:hypothetical protein
LNSSHCWLPPTFALAFCLAFHNLCLSSGLAVIWGADWPNEIVGSCRNLLAGYVLNLGFVVYFFCIQDGVMVAKLPSQGDLLRVLGGPFCGRVRPLPTW